jgi:predicted RNase H-like nuclease
VDGARGGWVAVALRGGLVADARVLHTLREIVDRYADAAAVGVDIPIGMPSGGEHRRADTLARRELGRRASSVFPTYPRFVYEAPYAVANETARARLGRGVSRQAHALGARILEADELAGRLVEVHPELSFQELAGRPLAAKTTWRGLNERIAALASSGIVLPTEGSAGEAPPVDLLDAAVVAWTARRRATGRSRSLPADPAPGEPAIWI